jgi:hypothetical protein
MSALVRLDLSGNELRTLPRALACLTNLESLELEDSQLKYLTPGVLPQLKKCAVVIVRFCFVSFRALFGRFYLLYFYLIQEFFPYHYQASFSLS